jgi:ferric-dicitrate binding protein FerR (iron transport regulator)
MDYDTLQQYIEGLATPKEKERVARWIDADESHKQQFLFLRRMYDAALWEAMGKKTHLPVETHPKKWTLYDFLKIAAVFLLLLGSYHFLYLTTTKVEAPPVEMLTIYVPEGQRAEFTLADGTKVWLNAKTTLTYPNYFAGAERNVNLDGEAYFDVTHNPDKPFIVQTEMYRVNVLGTEFNIKAYRRNHLFEASLIRGSVEVWDSLTNIIYPLKPEQKIYLSNGQLVTDKLHSHDPFLWKNGIIAFENESATAVFDKLQLYYDTHITINNHRLLNNRYTGKFRTKDGIEHVLKVMQRYHRFHYTKNSESNTIVIY